MKGKKKKAGKKGNGSKLITRAGLAIKQEFYLEASWILSALFERKLKKLLGLVEKQPPASGFTLEQSIKRVKYLHVSSKHPDLTSGLNLRIVDEIRNWKNQRNEILKDILNIHVSQARMERLATEGVKLYKELNKSVKSFVSTAAPADKEGKGNRKAI
ncbi:MAG: hypothetical protein NTW16_19660 [Bacteroidetes bacterium]|nr:hypothetical protein [Bacteroidota bacterium]